MKPLLIGVLTGAALLGQNSEAQFNAALTAVRQSTKAHTVRIFADHTMDLNARLQAVLEVQATGLDCSQALIEMHNAAYPSHAFAGVADIREELAGRPTDTERQQARTCALRALQKAQVSRAK
jgi:hypothetical protein